MKKQNKSGASQNPGIQSQVSFSTFYRGQYKQKQELLKKSVAPLLKRLNSFISEEEADEDSQAISQELKDDDLEDTQSPKEEEAQSKAGGSRLNLDDPSLSLDYQGFSGEKRPSPRFFKSSQLNKKLFFESQRNSTHEVFDLQPIDQDQKMSVKEEIKRHKKQLKNSFKDHLLGLINQNIDELQDKKHIQLLMKKVSLDSFENQSKLEYLKLARKSVDKTPYQLDISGKKNYFIKKNQLTLKPVNKGFDIRVNRKQIHQYLSKQLTVQHSPLSKDLNNQTLQNFFKKSKIEQVLTAEEDHTVPFGLRNFSNTHLSLRKNNLSKVKGGPSRLLTNLSSTFETLDDEYGNIPSPVLKEKQNRRKPLQWQIKEMCIFENNKLREQSELPNLMAKENQTKVLRSVRSMRLKTHKTSGSLQPVSSTQVFSKNGPRFDQLKQTLDAHRTLSQFAMTVDSIPDCLEARKRISKVNLETSKVLTRAYTNHKELIPTLKFCQPTFLLHKKNTQLSLKEVQQMTQSIVGMSMFDLKKRPLPRSLGQRILSLQ